MWCQATRCLKNTVEERNIEDVSLDEEGRGQHAVCCTGGDESMPDGLRLLDDATFETTDRTRLQPHELATSLCSITFTGDSTAYYATGSGIVVPGERDCQKVSHSSVPGFLLLVYSGWLITNDDCIMRS